MQVFWEICCVSNNRAERSLACEVRRNQKLFGFYDGIVGKSAGILMSQASMALILTRMLVSR
jgi:hypothetical protein